MHEVCDAQWFKKIFLSLAKMFDPDENPMYMDYQHLMTTSASLALVLMLADPGYEARGMEFPPSELEFDIGGSLTLGDYKLLVEGGEIKSSYRCG